MRDGRNGTKTLVLGTLLSICCPLLAAHANSTSHGKSSAHRTPTAHVAMQSSAHYNAKPGKAFHGRLAMRGGGGGGGGVSCVPYARSVSGITVAGNAWQWWDNAEGSYARGHVPEPGSVLTFRSNGRMRLGHVAVVSRVINAREIEIDHANWGGYRGGVARGVPVVDVSEANNWSAVRVGLSRSGDFGSIYPTYGFIYDRPDSGVLMARNSRPAPTPVLNQAPADLRPVAERPWRTYEEVAEAPQAGRRRLDLRTTGGQVVGQVLPVGGADRR